MAISERTSSAASEKVTPQTKTGGVNLSGTVHIAGAETATEVSASEGESDAAAAGAVGTVIDDAAQQEKAKISGGSGANKQGNTKKQEEAKRTETKRTAESALSPTEALTAEQAAGPRDETHEAKAAELKDNQLDENNGQYDYAAGPAFSRQSAVTKNNKQLKEKLEEAKKAPGYAGAKKKQSESYDKARSAEQLARETNDKLKGQEWRRGAKFKEKLNEAGVTNVAELMETREDLFAQIDAIIAKYKAGEIDYETAQEQMAFIEDEINKINKMIKATGLDYKYSMSVVKRCLNKYQSQGNKVAVDVTIKAIKSGKAVSPVAIAKEYKITEQEANAVFRMLVEDGILDQHGDPMHSPEVINEIVGNRDEAVQARQEQRDEEARQRALRPADAVAAAGEAAEESSEEEEPTEAYDEQFSETPEAPPEPQAKEEPEDETEEDTSGLDPWEIAPDQIPFSDLAAKRAQRFKEKNQKKRDEEAHKGVDWAVRWLGQPLVMEKGHEHELEAARADIAEFLGIERFEGDWQYIDTLIKYAIGLGPDHRGYIFDKRLDKFTMKVETLNMAREMIVASIEENGHPFGLTRYDDPTSPQPRYPVPPPMELIYYLIRSDLFSMYTSTSLEEAIRETWKNQVFPEINMMIEFSGEYDETKSAYKQGEALKWMLMAAIPESRWEDYGLNGMHEPDLFDYSKNIDAAAQFIKDPDIHKVCMDRKRRMAKAANRNKLKKIPGDRLFAGALQFAKTADVIGDPPLVSTGAIEHGINNGYQKVFFRARLKKENMLTKQQWHELKKNQSLKDAYSIYDKLYTIGGPSFVALYEEQGGKWTIPDCNDFLTAQGKIAGGPVARWLAETGDKVQLGKMKAWENDDLHNMLNMFLYHQQLNGGKITAETLARSAARPELGRMIVTSDNFANVRNQTMNMYNGGTSLLNDFLGACMNRHGGIGVLLAGIHNSKFVRFTWRALERQIPFSNCAQLALAKGIIAANDKFNPNGEESGNAFQRLADIAECQAFVQSGGFRDALVYDAMQGATNAGAIIVLGCLFAFFGLTPPADEDKLLDYDEWTLELFGVPIQANWFTDDIMQYVLPGAVAFGAFFSGKTTIDQSLNIFARGWYDTFFEGNKAWQLIESMSTGFKDLGEFLEVEEGEMEIGWQLVNQFVNIVDRATPMAVKDIYVTLDPWERDSRYYNGEYIYDDENQIMNVLNQKAVDNPLFGLLTGHLRYNFDERREESELLANMATAWSFDYYLEKHEEYQEDEDAGREAYNTWILNTLAQYDDWEEASECGFFIPGEDYGNFLQWCKEVRSDAQYYKGLANNGYTTEYTADEYQALVDSIDNARDLLRVYDEANDTSYTSPLVYDNKYMYKVYNTSTTEARGDLDGVSVLGTGGWDEYGESYYYGDQEYTGDIVQDLLRKWFAFWKSPADVTNGEGLKGYEDTEVGYNYQTNSYQDIGVEGTKLTEDMTSGQRALVVDTENKWVEDEDWDKLVAEVERRNGDYSSTSTGSYTKSYSGGSKYSSSKKVYAITPNSINPDRGSTMYSKTPYSTSKRYLNPSFTQQGSRDAYVRNLL